MNACLLLTDDATDSEAERLPSNLILITSYSPPRGWWASPLRLSLNLCFLKKMTKKKWEKRK